MRSILHVKSDTADARAEAVIQVQLADPELSLEIVDLKQSEPDYGSLLEKIFASDSVSVW